MESQSDIERIVRPKDYGCRSFLELANHMSLMIKAGVQSNIAMDVVHLLASFVVWEGPKLYMRVDMYWPRDKKMYKGVVIAVSPANKQFLQVRYTGWSKIWNEWCDFNVHHTEQIPGKQMGRIFPADSCTFSTRVGFGMCHKSTKRVKARSHIKKGQWVVYVDKDVDYKFLAKVIGFDRDCVPLQIKIDRGGGKFLHVLPSTLHPLKKPPRVWICGCGGRSCGSLWCETCGAMWKHL